MFFPGLQMSLPYFSYIQMIHFVFKLCCT